MYETYGVLYNQSAAETACPPGTHLPSDEEWHNLESFFTTTDCDPGRSDWQCSPAGANLKATSGWSGTDGNGDNISGFNALPGGFYRPGGGSSGDKFDLLKYHATFWSSLSGVNREVKWSTIEVYRYKPARSYGYSVRCVQ